MDEVIKIWVPFIGLFSSISLALFVLRHNSKSWIFRTYALYALYVALLHLGLLGLDPLLNLGMILLPIGFFQFVLALTKRFTPNNKIILAIGYLAGLLLLLRPSQIIYNNLIYNLLFGTFFIYSTWLLHLQGKITINPLEKTRILYLALAVWVVLLKFLMDIFGSLGWILSPSWNLTLVLQPFIMAYTIIKFRPMDLFTILRKTAIYTIVSFFHCLLLPPPL